MIVFRNEGLIPLEAITTMGVNVKPGAATPIGYFGTGLKYAVAVALREGFDIQIHRGPGQIIRFGTRDVDVRGKTFTQVTMGGDPLGFTIDLGKNWQPWMMFRELYSNCLDESGRVEWLDVPEEECLARYAPVPLRQPSEPSPTSVRVCDALRVGPKETVVTLSGPGAEVLWNQKDRFFLPTDGEPLHRAAEVEVWPGGNDALFYKGIMVGQLNKRTLYTYNLVGHVSLTEDRTVRHEYEAADPIRAMVARSQDPEFIKKMVTAPEGLWEHQLSFYNMEYVTPSEVFVGVVGGLARDGAPVNLSARRYAEIHERRALTPESVKLTEREEFELELCLTILEEDMQANVREYPVIVTEKLGDGQHLGLMEDGKIYISRRALTMGHRILLGTLFEEWIHARFGFKDCSRQFQNYVIDRMAQMIDEWSPPTKDWEPAPPRERSLRLEAEDLLRELSVYRRRRPLAMTPLGNIVRMDA